MIRLVIADDAEDVRMLVRLALDRDTRFEVVGEAANGREALAQVERCGPDLLLLDLAMPNMDGLEVLEALQQRDGPPTVVVISGFANSTMIDRALALGAIGYIEKGRDLDEIVELLARVVA